MFIFLQRCFMKLNMLSLVIGTLTPFVAMGQVEWSGDTKDADLYQYMYVQCGAQEGASECPYNTQSANTPTVNTSSMGNCYGCTSPSSSAGCRICAAEVLENTATGHEDAFKPHAWALKFVVAGYGDPGTAEGDNAPDVGYPWGEDFRTELSQIRDFQTGNPITFENGDERYFGWSSYIPDDFPDSPELTEEAQTPWGQLIFQIHHHGYDGGSPYIGINMKQRRSEPGKWYWALDGLDPLSPYLTGGGNALNSKEVWLADANTPIIKGK